MFAFWQSLLFIFIAEMGDKSQLMALAFGCRLPTRVVLAGIFAATLLVHLASVAIGEVLGLALPTFWIGLAAGLAFVGFGIWTLRGDTLDDPDAEVGKRFGAFATVAATFFLAELGDKTMLATITLASQLQAFVPVWIGSTVGMVVADGLAIWIGRAAGRRLPERTIRYAAAAIFILSGLLTLADTLRGVW
ncbi:MAG: TMEM165/GDT1 family protein [Chloroflexi bacterium]|nr:TMEM165/GDT1 family protein [Chloroflexota bacterium]